MKTSAISWRFLLLILDIDKKASLKDWLYGVYKW